MNHHRTALLLLACATRLVTHAQPYSVYITGIVQDCSDGSSILLQTGPGVTPVTTELLGPLEENNGTCGFSTSWSLDDVDGTIEAWAVCSNGDSVLTSTFYDVNLQFDSATVVIYAGCTDASAIDGPERAVPPSLMVLIAPDGSRSLRLIGYERGSYPGGVWDQMGRQVERFSVQISSSRTDVPLRGDEHCAPGVYTVMVGRDRSGSKARFVLE